MNLMLAVLAEETHFEIPFTGFLFIFIIFFIFCGCLNVKDVSPVPFTVRKIPIF